uniref:Uncharacterized protein n=1 Tax=Rhizophora mucronata TaxID=61149 RepID=A0A2P2JK42_RHIMU
MPFVGSREEQERGSVSVWFV